MLYQRRCVGPQVGNLISTRYEIFCKKVQLQGVRYVDYYAVDSRIIVGHSCLMERKILLKKVPVSGITVVVDA